MRVVQTGVRRVVSEQRAGGWCGGGICTFFGVDHSGGVGVGLLGHGECGERIKARG